MWHPLGFILRTKSPCVARSKSIGFTGFSPTFWTPMAHALVQWLQNEPPQLARNKRKERNKHEHDILKFYSVMRGTNLTIGRSNWLVAVFTVTTRTFPVSGSLRTWTTLARGHFPGWLSSLMRTISPIFRLSRSNFHLLRCCKVFRYSLLNLCQKLCTRF